MSAPTGIGVRGRGPGSIWQDPDRTPGLALRGERRADVAIVGAGFTGLWTALHLTDRDPGLEVVVVEAEHVGYGASGRNGGFVEASLTHGLANGVAHFPDEIEDLVELGEENYRDLVAFVRDHGIDCALEGTGTLDVATAAWQTGELAESAELHTRMGLEVELLDAADVRAEIDSPTYLGGLHRPRAGGILDPGALARGLAGVARDRGVDIYEHSPVGTVVQEGTGVRVRTAEGAVTAAQAVLATNAYTHRIERRLARHYVPVHDYVLVTEPLTIEQLARIGWKQRQGVADSGNRFHYYRLTADDRILWGGYDAIYRFGNGVGPRFDHSRGTYDVLARHFRATFPQLSDVGFAAWWGGPIATTTRFTAAFGDLLGGRVLYALGYTGLGVAATRFAGRVLSDRILAPDSPLLRLRFTTSSPFPFPPEPIRSVAVQLTRRALARADDRSGRRGPWLRALDRIGIGFDS